MKLYGRDVSVDAVMAHLEERLGGRSAGGVVVAEPGVEPKVEPLSFNLEKLAEHADPTRGLPVESHRSGVGGQLVVLAKRAFRAAGQVFINEALGRQGVFNGHVRDSYAQLAAEVMRLRAKVEALEAEKKSRT